MGGLAKKWTQEEDEVLRSHYRNSGARGCAAFLDRTEKAIRKRSRDIGVASLNCRADYRRDHMAPIVAASRSHSEVALRMGLRVAGGNIGIIKKYVALYQLDVSHFEKQSDRARRLGVAQTIPMEKIFCEHSVVSRAVVKKRLFALGLRKRECELCGQDEMWRGKRMSLILDHKNGVFNDNRDENLQIVCPNCNATLPTHCGKNKDRRNK